jgi:hypothetical protein
MNKENHERNEKFEFERLMVSFLRVILFMGLWVKKSSPRFTQITETSENNQQ